MNESNATSNMIVTLICVVILGVCGAFIITNLNKQINRLQREVDYANKTYLVKQGWTKMWGTDTNGMSYNLRSFDGGRNWYAASIPHGPGQNDGVIILGKADEIYPGLRKHLDDTDTLTEYVSKHGPLTLANDAEIQMLENVGFTVKRK